MFISTHPDMRAHCVQSSNWFGKGQVGSALMGSLQISCFLTEGPFGYSL